MSNIPSDTAFCPNCGQGYMIGQGLNCYCDEEKYCQSCDYDWHEWHEYEDWDWEDEYCPKCEKEK